MSGETHDADGDVVMTVSQPVFELIQAPKIQDWSQAVIVKLLKAGNQYESRMHHRCTNSDESLVKALSSVKSSFEPKLLEVVSRYEFQTTVDEVTEAQLLQLIYKQTNNVKNAFVPYLHAYFRKHLKMDLKEVDIDARVLKYYRNFSELIEKHGFG
ncbi:hypothetical protein PHMEG_00017674 [Phytophthora megakarya]|uniref:Uncharacterized protein n=1 Tax=Phytophthora megakarya TaxID=4795 RepID=A0A225VYE2_9STRA|nr:hypothetical protein PHMEG_00017674 [Phytophthora megakarya]